MNNDKVFVEKNEVTEETSNHQDNSILNFFGNGMFNDEVK